MTDVPFAVRPLLRAFRTPAHSRSELDNVPEFVSRSHDEPPPNSAGDCNRFGRHQSRSLRLTLSDPDANVTAPERRREAAKVAFNILIILMGSALVELKVLSTFGISLDVFRVVGGMIIAYMGFDMLRGPYGRSSAAGKQRHGVRNHSCHF